jgi:hypothetical protein
VKDRSAEIEARARALAESASAKLKAAEDRIHSLEMECEKLNCLVAGSRDRAFSAENALQGAEAHIGALEVKLSEAEKRAGESEHMLKCVADAIRSEILKPHDGRNVRVAA